MKDIQAAIQALINFRDQRDWEQFHNPKDIAIALSIEAAELQECFLWKQAEEAAEERVKEELADVLCYALLMAAHYDFDPLEIIEKKMAKNALKYPIDQSKGSALKYTDF